MFRQITADIWRYMRRWGWGGSSTDTWHQIGVVKDTAFISPARLFLWNSSVFPWLLIFLPAEMPTHWTMMFFRMRDHLVIDGLLLKELRSCCAKESNFLPREAGLKLMESASGEVTHWPNFTSRCQCVCEMYIDLHLFFSLLHLIWHNAFVESHWSFCKMQRHQSGRTVEPDQFLWLQNPNFCSGCQLARQIPYNHEGSSFTKV